MEAPGDLHAPRSNDAPNDPPIDVVTAGCSNHPHRPPVGRCPRCSRLVCQECHVRLDGILHCRECLAEAEKRLGRRRGPALERIGAALLLLVALPVALGSAYLVISAGGLAAGRLTRRFAVAVERELGETRPR